MSNMTIFTRVPFAYWADRIGFPFLFSGIGIFLTILILVNGKGELALPETILSLFFSAAPLLGESFSTFAITFQRA